MGKRGRTSSSFNVERKGVLLTTAFLITLQVALEGMNMARNCTSGERKEWRGNQHAEYSLNVQTHFYLHSDSTESDITIVIVCDSNVSSTPDERFSDPDHRAVRQLPYLSLVYTFLFRDAASPVDLHIVSSSTRAEQNTQRGTVDVCSPCGLRDPKNKVYWAGCTVKAYR